MKVTIDTEKMTVEEIKTTCEELVEAKCQTCFNNAPDYAFVITTDKNECPCYYCKIKNTFYSLVESYTKEDLIGWGEKVAAIEPFTAEYFTKKIKEEK